MGKLLSHGLEYKHPRIRCLYCNGFFALNSSFLQLGTLGGDGSNEQGFYYVCVRSGLSSQFWTGLDMLVAGSCGVGQQVRYFVCLSTLPNKYVFLFTKSCFCMRKKSLVFLKKKKDKTAHLLWQHIY